MGVGPSVYSKTQGGHTQKDRAVPPASSALTGGAEQARGLAFAIYSTLLLVLSFLVMSTLVLKQGGKLHTRVRGSESVRLGHSVP